MSKYTGAWGEVLAARYLRDRGLPILAANYRTRFGEIDIVSQEKGVLLFVEVKTRSPGMIALPLESVDTEKQRKLSLAAAQYLRREPPNTPSRFDIIEVYLGKNEQLEKINHIQSAFESSV